MTDEMQILKRKGEDFYLGDTKLQNGMGVYVQLDDNEVPYGEFKKDQQGEATVIVISSGNVPATLRVEGKRARLAESE